MCNNQIQEHKWNSLLTKSSFASPFQGPEFYKLFNSITNFQADVFAVEIENNYTCLMVVTIQKEKGLKTFFSRRGIIYGGPLLLSGFEKSFENLLHFINQYYKKSLIYLEVRNYSDYSNLTPFFNKYNWKYIPWLNFQKDISSEAIAKSTISESRMRQIKKALKSGAMWQKAELLEDIESFYTILIDLYQNKIKKPLFPFSFFKNFFEQSIGVFLIVKFEGKVIGGIMCPIYPEKTIYEFYICGLDKEYRDQYPSIMATWAAIEYGLQHNLLLFDFMGAGSTKEDYGVREFKARFGGALVENGRFQNILNPFLYTLGKFGLNVLSILK